MPKLDLKTYALAEAIKDTPDAFRTTDLAAHEHGLAVHLMKAADRELRTGVNDPGPTRADSAGRVETRKLSA